MQLCERIGRDIVQTRWILSRTQEKKQWKGRVIRNFLRFHL